MWERGWSLFSTCLLVNGDQMSLSVGSRAAKQTASCPCCGRSLGRTPAVGSPGEGRSFVCPPRNRSLP